MTTITDRPGGVTWEAFAEATLAGDEAARGMGRELAARTKGRHRRPRRTLLPLWAGALLLAFQGLRELDAATAGQLAEIARGGAL